MHQILVYGDSMSWGIIPGTRKRLGFDQRWPGVLEQSLLLAGKHVRVVEDCLNGRRTVWEDPFKPGRKGIDGIGQRIESCSPLAMVVVMLGVNDFQDSHQNNAYMSAQGVAALVLAIRQAPIEPDMPIPQILIVAPPEMLTPQGTMAFKFEGGQARCAGWAQALQDVATSLDCHFFNAGNLVTPSKVDGIHLDAPEHLTLGHALGETMGPMLSDV
jgi:lysophospholipase L1-like esterase